MKHVTGTAGLAGGVCFAVTFAVAAVCPAAATTPRMATSRVCSAPDMDSEMIPAVPSDTTPAAASDTRVCGDLTACFQSTAMAASLQSKGPQPGGPGG